ncbi:hypothetical protein GE21DRAFT_1102077 [Neurospora crassa]|nr:hypothetical protein GE21DRAFT_1102077 [Neurospora crassa]
MLLTTLPRPFGRMPRHHPRRPDRISNAARGESRRFRIAKILLVCAEYNICRMPSFCTFLFFRDCRNDSDQTAQPCRHEMRVAMGTESVEKTPTWKSESMSISRHQSPSTTSVQSTEIQLAHQTRPCVQSVDNDKSIRPERRIETPSIRHEKQHASQTDDIRFKVTEKAVRYAAHFLRSKTPRYACTFIRPTP